MLSQLDSQTATSAADSLVRLGAAISVGASATGGPELLVRDPFAGPQPLFVSWNAAFPNGLHQLPARSAGMSERRRAAGRRSSPTHAEWLALTDWSMTGLTKLRPVMAE